jgi:hypothetical protein
MSEVRIAFYEWRGKAPNTKLQAPDKLQAPKHQTSGQRVPLPIWPLKRMGFGAWCLEFIWILDFGAWSLFGVSPGWFAL